MRVVEANDILAAFTTLALDTDQVFGIDVVAIVCGIRPRVTGAGNGSHDAFVAIHPPKQHSAAFVRIGLLAMLA